MGILATVLACTAKAAIIAGAQVTKIVIISAGTVAVKGVCAIPTLIKGSARLAGKIATVPAHMIHGVFK